MKTSRKIKMFRSIHNLTQQELAEKLGVAFATVNRWERGHYEMSPLAEKGLSALGIKLREEEEKEITSLEKAIE